jgi:hypothetical protein
MKRHVYCETSEGEIYELVSYSSNLFGKLYRCDKETYEFCWNDWFNETKRSSFDARLKENFYFITTEEKQINIKDIRLLWEERIDT